MVIVPFVVLVTLIVAPREYISVFVLLMLLFHLHICFSRTFDAIMRMSRYRLSQQWPILNRIVSLAVILFCFLGGSFLVSIMLGYSIYVSPDETEKAETRWYAQPYIKPFAQGIILLIAFVVVILKRAWAVII